MFDGGINDKVVVPSGIQEGIERDFSPSYRNNNNMDGNHSHPNGEHEVKVEASRSNNFTEFSPSLNEDLGLCTFCGYCDFKTFNTLRFEKHILARHKGMVVKSMSKTVSKSVSRRVRHADALFFTNLHHSQSQTNERIIQDKDHHGHGQNETPSSSNKCDSKPVDTDLCIRFADTRSVHPSKPHSFEQDTFVIKEEPESESDLAPSSSVDGLVSKSTDLEVDVAKPLSENLFLPIVKNEDSVQSGDNLLPLAQSIPVVVTPDNETNQEKSVLDVTNAEVDSVKIVPKDSNFCVICFRKFAHCVGDKNSVFLKHSKAFCPLAPKSSGEEQGDPPLLPLHCPRQCSFLTSNLDAFNEHISVCYKPEVHSQRVQSPNSSVIQWNGRSCDNDTKTATQQSIFGKRQNSDTGQLTISLQGQKEAVNINEVHFQSLQQQCYVKTVPASMDSHSMDQSHESGTSTSSLGQRNQPRKRKTTLAGEKPHKCSVCGKSFNKNSHLIRHMRTHTGEKPYKCSECGKSFQDSTDVIRHMSVHTGERAYKCSECTKSFHKRSDLIRHMRTHTGEKPYKCSECGKSFHDSSDVTRHMSVHTGVKPFKCSECGKTFLRSTNLIRHTRTHTGEKPYHCPVCGKSFRDSSDLIRHKAIHSEEKPYRCSECGKSFGDIRDRNSHMRTHTGEKPYKCSECGKGFCESAYLHRHMRIHTKEKAYKCSECGKSFRDSSDIIRHMTTHTGEKPYRCSECGRGFRSNSDLNGHMRVHTGEKPYKCTECGECFRDSSHRNSHMRIHIRKEQCKSKI